MRAIPDNVGGVSDGYQVPQVELRPLVDSDWNAVHSWASLEQFCRYQAWGPNTETQTRDFVREAVASGTSSPRVRFVYAITYDGNVVGSCELNLRGGQQGEVAYGLHPDHWGGGLATTAVAKLLDLGFGEHRLHRIFATCDPRNVASAGVLKRLAMTHEGRLREVLFIRDGWRDSDMYGLLVHEWAQSQSTRGQPHPMRG